MASEKRLIDARWLTSQMYMICEVCQTENIFIDAIIDEIDNAPDVDAVEVVRCKDCKHWKHLAHLGCTDFVKLCSLANYMIGANGYCLYGERKDNE